MDKVYRGSIKSPMEWEVTVDDKPLNPRLDLMNHSPTGFAWGYHGSGPAQLALALIADATGDDLLALRTYQAFKHEILAPFRQNEGWQMSQDFIVDWCKWIEVSKLR